MRSLICAVARAPVLSRAVSLGVDALGQMIGYAFGAGTSGARLALYECHRAKHVTALRRRGRGRFVRDLGFHTRFLRSASQPLSTRNGRGAVRVAALLVVWQIANLAGFVFEALVQRLPSEGPAAKIS